MRPTGNPKNFFKRREQAINLLCKGYRPVDVAKIVGVDRRSVRRWNAAYRKNGKNGIQCRPNTGRPSRLNVKAKQKLEKLLLKGAKAAGYPNDLWTCPRIVHLIKRHFSIKYHVDHVCRLLHSFGWSPQKPERRAVERNENQIQTWLKVQWPRIKKNGPIKCAAGFH